MIDTVVLLLPSRQFTIDKPEKFTPCSDMIYQHRAIKAVLNSSAQERKLGIYKPRLTLSKRKNIQGISEIMLTIEASLPKLLWGNNLDELRAKDLASITMIIHSLLQEAGVNIAPIDIENAEVIAVHYAKNIVFKDGSTPFHYIQKIQQMAKPAALDSNQTDYRNAGHCFKYHCNAYEVVFYDKLFDLQTSQTKGSKRAIDGDCVFDMKSLNKIRNKRKKFEMLRMEVRINKRSKLKQLLQTLKIKTDLTLRKLFRPAIAQKVLLHYIDRIENKRSLLIDFKPQSDRALLTAIALSNPRLKAKQVLQFFGIKKVLESVSFDELKRIIATENKASWTRLLKELETVVMPSSEKPFEPIKEQLRKYNPLKLS